jgi:hypothetical protein
MKMKYQLIVLAVLPFYFLGFGLRGILTKKAFVVSTQRMLWIFLIAIVPLLLPIGDIISGFRKRSFDFLDFSPLVMFGLFFLLIWKMTGGYSILGATDEHVQNALRAALQKLNLPFEESVARVRLTSLDADLTLSVSGFGVAQMRLKQPQYASTLKQIADCMNVYFATVPGKVNAAVFYVYVLMGVLLLVQIVWILSRTR